MKKAFQRKINWYVNPTGEALRRKILQVAKGQVSTAMRQRKKSNIFDDNLKMIGSEEHAMKKGEKKEKNFHSVTMKVEKHKIQR